MSASTVDPRYPIGKYESRPFSEALRKEWLLQIQQLPTALEYAITNLDANQLETPYREGGWTLRQVVHHIADSHLNALCRLKLTLTEDNPSIRPYNEKAWAETSEYHHLPINQSLTLLHSLHARLYDLFANASESDWKRTYYHPEAGKSFDLWFLLGMYAWHGRHHTAHITSTREREGW